MYLGEFDDKSRSREGAWIEIVTRTRQRVHLDVAPARERGLKFLPLISFSSKKKVAPARERGLKLSLIARMV